MALRGLEAPMDRPHLLANQKEARVLQRSTMTTFEDMTNRPRPSQPRPLVPIVLLHGLDQMQHRG